MEHRWGQRISTDVAVSLVATPATIGVGRMLNVSSTGAFVQTRLHVPLLSFVYLEPADLAVDGCVVGRIGACVVRRCADGVGLEWCDDAADAVERLMSAVRGKAEESALSGRQRRDPVERFSGG